MSNNIVFVDRFSSADDIPKKERTYERVKAAVLKAGRFSCFEASEDAINFNRLHRDPELEIIDLGYPWVGVKMKEPK
jgi:hypothetical protein